MTFSANHLRPSLPAFREYLPFFLRDNPSETCPKGGHAAYGDVSPALGVLWGGGGGDVSQGRPRRLRIRESRPEGSYGREAACGK